MGHIKAVIAGRDEITYSESEGVTAIGCTKLIEKIDENLRTSGKDPKMWPVPESLGHEDLLIKELVLKAQGKFNLPYNDDEICHCRSITTDEVIQSIKAGAHTIERIRALTDANTACGTCAPDCESLLNFLLKPQQTK